MTQQIGFDTIIDYDSSRDNKVVLTKWIGFYSIIGSKLVDLTQLGRYHSSIGSIIVDLTQLDSMNWYN